MRYIALTPVSFEGKRYNVGDTFEALDDPPLDTILQLENMRQTGLVRATTPQPQRVPVDPLNTENAAPLVNTKQPERRVGKRR